MHASREGVLPFFLTATVGERFCLYHQPAAAQPSRGSIIYAHPFAEEINKSRRMAALQARAFAQAGYSVLQMDLYGCGDSAGDFGDARWDIWLDDLALGWHWLLERSEAPLYLWGLRLGALLALDFARRVSPDMLILWQPVISGRAHLNQFARMQNTARLFSEAPRTTGHDAGTEIAGYKVAPELSAAINLADASALKPRCPVQWLELNAPPPKLADTDTAAVDLHKQPALQAASAVLVQRWRDEGATVHTHPLHGELFWSSAEITVSAELLPATLAAMPVADSLARI